MDELKTLISNSAILADRGMRSCLMIFGSSYKFTKTLNSGIV